MTLLIPFVSLLPARFFAPASAPLPPMPGMDKLVHAMLYAALTAAYLHALAPSRRNDLAAVLPLAVSTTVYGAAMEVSQSLFTDSRTMDPLDALANLTGVLATTLISLAVHRCRERKTRTS